MLLAGGMQLGFPAALAYFIDHASQPDNQKFLTLAALSMLVLFALYCAATACRYYLFESLGVSIVRDLRRQLHHAIVHQSLSFFDHNKVGELTSRLTSDAEALKHTLSISVSVAMRSLIVATGATAMLFYLSPRLTLLLLIVIPIAMLLAKWLGKRARNLSRAIQDHHAASLQIAQENFSHIKLIKAFNLQNERERRFTNQEQQVLTSNLQNARLFALFQGLTTYLTFSALLLILWVGGHSVYRESLTLGELTSFVIYAGMLTGSTGGLTAFWGDWMRSRGASQRVFEIIEQTPAHSLKRPPSRSLLDQDIEFSDVCFSYPSRPDHLALNHLNLRIKAGEKVALTGPSGSGKSTIASLLLGFYFPTEGQVTIGGEVLSPKHMPAIRDRVAIVEQEPSLFTGSIAENIWLGASHTQLDPAAIETVAKQANAFDFIQALPAGFDTQVGERGAQLSGGQKQRIAIARALLRDPDILILDEATSALDQENAVLVEQALSRLMEGRTTIVIAHQTSSLKFVERVISLVKGHVAGEENCQLTNIIAS